MGVTPLSWTPSLMARVHPPCPTILAMAAPVPLLPGEIWSFSSLLSPKSAGMTHTGSLFPQLPLSCTSAPPTPKISVPPPPEATKAQKSESALLLVTSRDTTWARTSAEVTSTQHPAGSFQKLGSNMGHEQSRFPCCTHGSADLRTRNEPNNGIIPWKPPGGSNTLLRDTL